MKKIPLIIDTDGGIDDAMALLMAFDSDALNIKLISTVKGNVSVDQVVKNVAFLVEKYAKYDIKIAKGAEKPLELDKIKTESAGVHGETGLGNFVMPQVKKVVEKEDAVEALYNELKSSNEKMTIAAIGPLTNIAMLLQKHKDIQKKIKQIYIMGGSAIGFGNTMPWAEFNCYVDVVAFDMILKSGLPLIIAPIELGTYITITKDEFWQYNRADERSVFIKSMLEGLTEPMCPDHVNMFDPCTILALIKPKLFKYKRVSVHLDTSKKKSGRMYMVADSKSKHKLQYVTTDLDVKKEISRLIFGW